jgi:adenosylcobinamide-GDP ribazoletransferase
LIRRFLGALQYLTIVPVRARTAEPGKSAVFFPLVAAALGAAGGFLLEGARGYLPFTLVALLVLAFWTLITGGLHEDGFADCFDAFRSWRAPEHILTILKDSRIGAHGAIALLLLYMVRWQALSAITIDAVGALAAALALGRGAVVALAWVTPAATDGSAARFTATLTTSTAVFVIAQVVLIAFLPGPPAASFLLGGTTTILLAARAYFNRRIGGITGDCLGATEQLVETWCFIVYACPPCTS